MRGGWGGGGGGVGGIPASFPSRSPPPKQPFQPTPTPSPGSHQEVCEVWVVFVGKGPRPLAGRAPTPEAPWRPGPQAPGAWIPPLSLISCKPSLTSCCVSNPWVRVSKRYHNPQSADLGGRWMVSEGGAVQFHERRGSRLRSSISAGPGPKPLGDLANKPALHPGQEFQKCPGAHRLMKSLACCTD